MKIIVAVNVLIMILLLMSCQIWDEDHAGDQKCVKYDQTLDVSFVTTKTIDSIQFFMNGIQVCIPYDYSFFRENRGTQGFQERFYNRQKNFACEVGTMCDNFEGELNNFLIKISSFDKTDSILLTKNGLAQLAYNKAYRVFTKSDSSLIFNLDENLYTYIGC